MKFVFKKFVPSALLAYSCQTWISRLFNELVHPGKYHCWIAKSLNPMNNGDSSNSLWLYMTLDRAVKQNDLNNAKIKDVRVSLMRAADVLTRAPDGKATSIGTEAIRFIGKADVSYFHPQLWRVHLNRIDSKRYYGKYQYPDELLIPDLGTAEFEVMVE